MSIFVEGNVIFLYGDVGDYGGAEHFTATDVVVALGAIGRNKPVKVAINSGGGGATDGLAIYNTLAAHPGGVDVEVDAIAASAASLIAMAGRQIVMRRGSVMMIHDPAGITIGTAADHGKSGDFLDMLGNQYAGVYAARSGKSIAAVRQMMKEETWLTDSGAVAAGFATRAEALPAKAAASFDYRRYARAPEALVQRAPALRIDIAAEMRRRHGLEPAQRLAGDGVAAIRSDPTLRVDLVAMARRKVAEEEQARLAQGGRPACDAAPQLRVDLAAEMRRMHGLA